MWTHLHQPREFCLDVQIGMFSHEWETCDANLAGADLFHFVDLDYVFESTVFKQELQRGILQVAIAVAWNKNSSDLVAKLEQGFEKDVVRMAVCNQHVVNMIGQIEICESRDIALIGVTQHRIKQYGNPLRLDENARMPKITPAHSRPCVVAVSGRRLFGKETTDQSFAFRRNP